MVRLLAAAVAVAPVVVAVAVTPVMAAAAVVTPTVVVVYYARGQGDTTQDKEGQCPTKKKRQHNSKWLKEGRRKSRTYSPKRRPCQNTESPNKNQIG